LVTANPDFFVSSLPRWFLTCNNKLDLLRKAEFTILRLLSFKIRIIETMNIGENGED
jgi:hypothetical protein